MLNRTSAPHLLAVAVFRRCLDALSHRGRVHRGAASRAGSSCPESSKLVCCRSNAPKMKVMGT